MSAGETSKRAVGGIQDVCRKALQFDVLGGQYVGAT